MVYITVMQSPIYHQMTLEEYLSQNELFLAPINKNTSNTRTYRFHWVSERFKKNLNVLALIEKLERFNEATAQLRGVKRKSLYHTFPIPKKSGGLRRIDAPNPELMEALRQLKAIFENDFHALYHTSAFAYIKNRCAIDAVKRHQSNNSKWFAKLDLHDFFGSTTMEFVMSMLKMIFPFNEVMSIARGEQALRTALDLAFLNGGLPQGTPFSPTITNIMMIPIDFELSNGFREYNKQKFVYTRYADDFIVSSKYDFEVKDVERFIVDTLSKFGAPFSLNDKKTRYGSSAGQNWNLGVMLNKDNEITVGHKKKRQFQSMMYNYVMDKRNGIPWPLEDLREMDGRYSYYRMVERENIEAIVDHMNEKLGVDIFQLVRKDIKAG